MVLPTDPGQPKVRYSIKIRYPFEPWLSRGGAMGGDQDDCFNMPGRLTTANVITATSAIIQGAF